MGNNNKAKIMKKNDNTTNKNFELYSTESPKIHFSCGASKQCSLQQD